MTNRGKYIRTEEFKKSMSLLQQGRKISEEHKKKISLGNKGKIFTEEHKRKIGEKHKNKIVSLETRKRMSFSAKERLKNPENNNFYRKKHKDEVKQKLSLLRKGKKLKEFGHKEDCCCAYCNSYIDGRTPLAERIRHLDEYYKWRKSIFERDNYTCQECYEYAGKLEAHHIKRFSYILQEFLKEYSQFSPIEDKETLLRLATNYKSLWNVDNGKTLCMDCHDKTKLHIDNTVNNVKIS